MQTERKRKMRTLSLSDEWETHLLWFRHIVYATQCVFYICRSLATQIDEFLWMNVCIFAWVVSWGVYNIHILYIYDIIVFKWNLKKNRNRGLHIPHKLIKFEPYKTFVLTAIVVFVLENIFSHLKMTGFRHFWHSYYA